MPIAQDAIYSLYTIPGKVAIVTGAGSGIGEATAALMAQAGGEVVVADLIESVSVARSLAHAHVFLRPEQRARSDAPYSSPLAPGNPCRARP